MHGAASLDLRVYVTAGRSFHPKAYLLTRSYADGVAYVGSSNLSSSALGDGIEWNYRVESRRDAAGLALVRAAFESLVRDPQTRNLDEAWLAEYRERRPVLATQPGKPVDTLPEATPAASARALRWVCTTAANMPPTPKSCSLRSRR